MERNFIYLVNPISGTKDKSSVQQLIEEKTRKQKIPFTILNTVADGNYGFLQEIIRSGNITDVIVCGGDGTINLVASSLQGLPVKIGIIPLGSGNGLALAAGIPRNLTKAMSVIFKGNASYIDSFYINGRFSCMLCGLGFDAQVAHDFALQPTRGLATYIQQTVKNFFTSTAYRFTINVNETQINTEAFFISIANSNQFGNNVTIAPKASLCDGLLDIVIVNKMSKLKMVYSLLKQIRLGKVVPANDKKNNGRGIHYFQAKRLRIQNPDSAPLHIDGDPSPTSNSFEIEVIENAFLLLQP